MNILTNTGQMLANALRGVSASVQAPEITLKRAIERCDNGYTLQAERALAAIHAGRAAYWNTSNYHDASGGILLDALNGGLTFATGLARAYRYKSDDEKIAALDRLIPLNRQAANELSEAYEEFGTWRDAVELERRAV